MIGGLLDFDSTVPGTLPASTRPDQAVRVAGRSFLRRMIRSSSLEAFDLRSDANSFKVSVPRTLAAESWGLTRLHLQYLAECSQVVEVQKRLLRCPCSGFGSEFCELESTGLIKEADSVPEAVDLPATLDLPARQDLRLDLRCRQYHGTDQQPRQTQACPLVLL